VASELRLRTINTAEWKLIGLQLSPPRRTRPPREFLALWDVRVRRRTSPLWRPPSPLSPLPRTPPRTPARVHRGTQSRPETTTRATQTVAKEQTAPTSRSRGTQAEAPRRRDSATQTTPEKERVGTPPRTSKEPRRWGPKQRTKAQPTITWRERR